MIRRPTVIRSAIAALLVLGCGPTIEEEEEPELVEHRIRPCTQVCTAMLSPECGGNPEDLIPGQTVEECVEDCASAEPTGWQWAPQEDGTDACAEEWIAKAECIDALSCEDQHRFFTRRPAVDTDWPCKPEHDAALTCFYSTPSLEHPERE
jgi:hypothetical protein